MCGRAPKARPLTKTIMKTPKLLALCALSAGLLTVVATTPAFAKPAVRHQAKSTGISGITEAQRAQIAPIRSASKSQIKAIKADKTLSKKERKARIKALKADRNAKTNALLTPAQQQQFAAMRAQKKADKKAAKKSKV